MVSRLRIMSSYNNSINVRHSKELGVISWVTTHKSMARSAAFSFQLLHQVFKRLTFSSSCWKHIKIDSSAVYDLGIQLQFRHTQQKRKSPISKQRTQGPTDLDLALDCGGAFPWEMQMSKRKINREPLPIFSK